MLLSIYFLYCTGSKKWIWNIVLVCLYSRVEMESKNMQEGYMLLSIYFLYYTGSKKWILNIVLVCLCIKAEMDKKIVKKI